MITPPSAATGVRHGGRWDAPQHDLPQLVRRGLLSAAADAARAEGLPPVELRGQLIRPLVCMAALRHDAAPPDGFWDAALAIQLAHEASLVHDDVVDGAPTRRGRSTLVADSGVARALIEGDHLLTLAYRAAARTRCPAFMQLFARAVERTVAGEKLQGQLRGEVLEWSRYCEIVKGKSGELIGCALAAAPALEGGHTEALFELGRRLGLLYQMLDDLLDYCPSANTGKVPLRDYEQRRWTWVLAEVPGLAFEADADDVLDALHAPPDRRAGSPRESPMQRALVRLNDEAGRLRQAAARLIPEDHVTVRLQESWLRRARTAVAVEASARRRSRAPGIAITSDDPAALESELRSRIPSLSRADQYMARHSRSFRLASRFFPAADAARVAGVYAYCRITDDLVDRPAGGVAAEALLGMWLRLSRRAYEGERSGYPLLDTVMHEMARAAVPFSYAAELAEGMRMDLRGERYADLPALRKYTYRVASVVGLWLARLFGVHDAWMLERAERLGHAMQLTNILRDVGEDLDRGRVYLPAAVLRKHGLVEADLVRMRETGAIGSGYRALLEELMRVAEADYTAALEAVPALPRAFGRPVAVAAHVYRGIHREIRRRGYDNLRQRACTGGVTRVSLAARGLWELHGRRRAHATAVAGSLMSRVRGER